MGILTILDSYEHRKLQWWREVIRYIVNIVMRKQVDASVAQALETEVEL